MICKECKHFKSLANTNECGQGICGYPMSYFPVVISDECHFQPKTYTCGDCSHYIDNDDACMTHAKDDSAYHNGKLCCGFIDKNKDLIYNIFAEWKMRGLNINEELKEIFDDFNDFKCPWE